MSKSRFDSFNAFIVKRHRAIIVAWVVVLIASLVLIPSFFSAVNYNLTGSFNGPSNTESQLAQNVLNAQFPSATNGSNNIVIVVLQHAPVYSNQVKSGFLALNETLAKDPDLANYSGMQSIYNTEYDFLNSSLPSIVPQVAILQSNITTINSGLYVLQNNLSSLSSSIFQLQVGINQSAQLVYGIPSGFVEAWSAISQNESNPYVANVEANSTFLQQTRNLGGSQESLGYYTLFFNLWNSSFQSFPNTTSPLLREQASVNQSVQTFLQNPQISSQTKQIITLVSTGLNVTTWNQQNSIANLTITSIASSVPSQLSATLGVTAHDLVSQLYGFGPTPSNVQLSNYAITLFENSFSKNLTGSSQGFSISDLLHQAYSLGSSPSKAASWDLASMFVTNATAGTFSGSPLFSINETSLSTLLSGFGSNASLAQIQSRAYSVVSNQTFSDYPFALSRALTKNFVNQNNDTMIVLYKFGSSLDSKAINSFRSDTKSSGLSNEGTVYVTGGTVLSQDLQDAFTPALGVTVGPGVAISILIVALLFLAPLAAIIPLLIGGFSIAIAYSAIYLGIVRIGHGNITFLTPTLTTLLMLGLAVDYAVLQLRRTREERLNGKSTEESVAISVRWAGQAVITAGITVIVAYIVMAAANVPIFSDVGTSIALGVSILLAVSLTLLPSLELSLGDKLFWPSIKRAGSRRPGGGKSRLGTLTDSTLRRKVLVVGLISLFALGSVYLVVRTPTGSDLLKLIPNFQSNQGLTVITNSLGSSTIAPTVIVVTTSSPIVYGHTQFNQTLLNQIETISDAAANSSGVASVTGPTRPFGSPFDYSSIQNMSISLRSQYESGMLSQIGKNNQTAQILVGLSSSSESASAVNSLLRLEKSVGAVPLIKGVTLYYGGDTQNTYDSQSFLNGLLPQVIIILAVAVYIILFAQLRSAFTPLRLIFTILCSVAFSLATLSLIFYNYVGDPILNFAPLFVVVTMLGVGIDYDIFFVTRIREEVLNGKTDNQAIKTAVKKVWITILGLGLVLSTVFGSLLITGIALLQEISLAVSAAILIDVLVVILFFVPSLMGLAQRLNWWPSRPARNQTVTSTEE